jgi:hypothetical protein
VAPDGVHAHRLRQLHEVRVCHFRV